MNRFATVAAAFVLCLFCLFSDEAVAAELTVNKIAAVVNGEMISLHELRMHTAAELARRRVPPDDAAKVAEMQKIVLDSMINDILMRQEAKRFQLSVSDSEIEQEMQAIIRRSGQRPDVFEAELKKQGLSLDLYKERIGNNMLRQKISSFMVARKVFVTPEQVAEYFENNRDKFQGERTADFSIIMLPEKLDAQRIYNEIKSGKLSFEDAAKKYSSDRSADEGGRVAGVPWDKLPAEMQKLLSSLKDGNLSPLFKTKGGFILFRRNAINEAKALTFEEAKPYIEDMLRAPLLDERFNEYITQLRGKAVIDIRI